MKTEPEKLIAKAKRLPKKHEVDFEGATESGKFSGFGVKGR